MNRKKAALAGIGLALVAWLIFKFGFHRATAEPDLVRVSGNIEVTEAQLSFKIPGRVQERLVDEGQRVEKGTAIAVLETADLAAEVAIRQADLHAAQSQLAELVAGSRPAEIAAAKARLASSN